MNDTEFQIIISIVTLFSIFFLIFLFKALYWRSHIETPEKRAGRMGERFVSELIYETLHKDDELLTNVHIYADDKQTELDNVIINGNGVFIIEAKNYHGELFGNEDDSEWIKNKITPSGSIYQTTVNNPIRQVKRQIYILSTLLRDNGIDAWIEGYIFFVERNSPVSSEFVLETQSDIDGAIHTASKKMLSKKTQDEIISLLRK